MLEEAVSLHRAGNKKQAKNLYKEILALRSDEPDANHNLGLILWEEANFDQALYHVNLAIVSQPHAAEYWKSKCQMLISRKNHRELVPAFTDLIKITKNNDINDAINTLISSLLKILLESCSDRELLKIFMIANTDHPHFLDRFFAEFSSDILISIKRCLLSANTKEIEVLLNVVATYDPINLEYTIIFADIVSRAGEVTIEDIKNANLTDLEEASLSFHAGTILQRRNKKKDVAALLSNANKKCPGDPFYAVNYAIWLKDDGQIFAAIDVLQGQLAHAKDSHPTVHYNLGVLLVEIRDFTKAISEFEQVLRNDGNHASALYNLGVCYMELSNHEAADEFLRKSLESDPINAKALSNLALIKNYRNMKMEANDLIERGLALDDQNAQLWYTKAKIGAELVSEKQLIHLEELTKKLAGQNLIYAQFALAKFYKNKNVKKCYYYLKSANAAGREFVKYDPRTDQQLFQHINTKFNIPQIDAPGKVQIRPIFIVGMPRSGTTLIERVLSSVPDITALGELPFFSDSLAKNKFSLNNITLESLREVRNNYLENINGQNIATKCFTDKMPLNVRWVPIIISCFPEAKIICVIRDKRATVWSNYWQYFPRHGNAFTFDLTDIASYYDLCVGFMERCQREFRKKIFTLRYEGLVKEPNLQISKLAQFLNLEINPDELHQENHNFRTITASHEQVRKPVYFGSNDEWKKYREFLPPEIFLA